MMKSIRIMGAAVLPVLLACGCSTMTTTEKGIGTGGLIGAGTGALVGSATGHTGAGALIGAGVGALSGGLIGNAVEESEKRTEARIAAATAPVPHGPLGLTDVAQMAQAHVSDHVIITSIRNSGSVFRLSSSDVIWLKQQGVSDAVVTEMQNTAGRPQRHVYTPAPVYAQPVIARPIQPVYVVEPPPPPVSLGVGFGYTRIRR